MERIKKSLSNASKPAQSISGLVQSKSFSIFNSKLTQEVPQFFQKKGKFSLIGITAACLLGYYAHKNGTVSLLPRTAFADAQINKILLAWGAGNQGQLGIGTEVNSVGVPTQIISLQDEDIVQITAAGDVSAAITVDGRIYTWGRTKGGSIGGNSGLSPTTNLLLPTLIDAQEVSFKRVACGKNHVAAITSDGKLVTWGNPDQGKLGHIKKTLSVKEQQDIKDTYKKKGYSPKNFADYNEIDYVLGQLENKKVIEVACGFQHTACVTEDGEVYTWGFGKNGALGHDNWNQVESPMKVEGLSNIVKIDCGIDYTMCMDKDGKLYSWGSNRYGQLGVIGTNTYKINKPVQIKLPHEVSKVIDFSCGEEHSAFQTDKGEVYTWGYGNDGQLGHQDKQNLNTPRILKFDEKISKVICGGGHTGIITSQGFLYLFGRGRDGQLGRGDEMESMAAYRTEPKQVNSIQTKFNCNVIDLALGSNHCLSLAAKKI